MKHIKLNSTEVETLALNLTMSLEQAQEVADLFFRLQTIAPLNGVNDYIDEWQARWHRETNWQSFYEYEKENCLYDYEDNDTFENLENFKLVWNENAFELPKTKLIAVCS